MVFPQSTFSATGLNFVFFKIIPARGSAPYPISLKVGSIRFAWGVSQIETLSSKEDNAHTSRCV